MVFKGEVNNEFRNFSYLLVAGTPLKIKDLQLSKQISCRPHLCFWFFNDTGFNPVAPKFGMFDSADMWSFNGNLICTTIDNLRRAVSTVNSIKLAYLFSSSEDIERNLFDFVGIAQTYKVLVDNLVDYNTFYRLTGHKPVLVEDWSVDKLKEIFNG